VRAPPIDLDAGLNALGYEAFRPGQRESIETLLREERLLLVAPTGGGKSLTYQLPAALLDGTSLVISPLIALMHDQVEALNARGLPATYIASTLDRRETQRRLDAIANGEYKLVYVAPERLALMGFRGLLGRIRCPLLAVDEAHCISEWGHDFRPEYMQIGEVLHELPGARVLACTATATPIVRDEIIARLNLPPDTTQDVHGFARPNLRLRVEECGSGKARDRLVDAQLASALGGPGQERGAAIIYAPTRRWAEEEAQRLSDAGWNADCYHAGRSGAEREAAQRAFAAGNLEVVAATNAFGMGIDRADVRSVIHLGPPGSIESYYQEVGRAGRDGEPAWGLLCTSAGDLARRRKLLELPNDDGLPDPAVVEHKWGLFLELMRWSEGGSCRHDAILRYFGAEGTDTLEGCGHCDVCTSLGEDQPDADEVALTVRKALSGVARIDGRFGVTAAAKLLKGQKDERLERSGLDLVPTFGVLKERSEEWVMRLLRRCVTAGWVIFTGGDRPVARLTREGVQVMRGETEARLLLPPTKAPKHATGRKAPSVDLDALDDGERVLFEALRSHRAEVAREIAKPAYVVASDRALRDLARRAPRSREELLLVYGFGESKTEKYGDGFLDVIGQHSGE
jgi:ATP-dependent DNA helicase RecQ